MVVRWKDAECVLVANIGNYMGGVDLWKNEDDNYDDFDPQSMHDGRLKIVHYKFNPMTLRYEQPAYH
ncbi:hypothetical protein E3N88_32144 [Mikania micrantha]|uniref:Diacylglycerol kinase accessory domain-containing protein n=1 Tax=Mikania micrantha TaxID=192012 RepID=A0A5N6M7K7_9ASTR|nr:hypothetical protein E3N88_32144 [Mikania micrantha]